jgi:hypothetical protein
MAVTVWLVIGSARAEEVNGTAEATETPMECSATRYDGKLIVGEAEWIHLPKRKMRLKGRIDTGATTTSIDARNIRVQDRDGRKWVLFDLVDRESGKKIHMDKPVVRIAEIKRHGAEHQERPVVKLHLKIGETEKYVEVSLTDRSKYDFPVLIGRNFLRGTAVVDVSRAYVTEQERPAAKKEEK